ncbi:cytochrome b5 domain-containing protein 1 [Folsomia candida]|uniref:Cytochrome b5 domain-containing protein 1 n=1 Tax=Folsomia candida TaxID=158441 RepID=A0A226F5G7_FOLCA|nr:cytochrome b5 domain-containing protein 1 [Folsomia candida]XP_035713908.1 cytochrome b5 domain-containing protein 1 [Folsomia candida]XP_035713913.1 cytochrome b5 domain-containing protein 1 [Folsomia candida]OXA65062.1 Cytochrome b5 domain-containing protein 1 [Folsomia candida]
MARSKKELKKERAKERNNSVTGVEKKKVEKKVVTFEPFAIRIINTITYQQTRLTITKKFKVADIHEAYAPFESHPEYYLWQDMYGKNLDLNRTVVENGLVGGDETVEFDGIGKEPVIILVFRDGFENDIPPTLNPLQRKAVTGLCRNY